MNREQLEKALSQIVIAPAGPPPSPTPGAPATKQAACNCTQLPPADEKNNIFQVYYPTAESIRTGQISAEAQDKQGTAFLLHRDACPHPEGYRLLMTNHHVVKRALEARAQGILNLGYVLCCLQPTKFFQVSLVLSDAARDLAVVVIPEHAACGQVGLRFAGSIVAHPVPVAPASASASGASVPSSLLLPDPTALTPMPAAVQPGAAGAAGASAARPADDGRGTSTLPAHALREGERVRFWGFPRHYHGAAPLLTLAHVAGFGQYIAEGVAGAAPVPTVVLSASVHAGHSGSPVLDARGRVTGVLVTKHTERPASLLAQLAALHQARGCIRWISPDGSQSLDLTQCIADALAAALDAPQLGLCEALGPEAISAFLAQIPPSTQFTAMLPPAPLPDPIGGDAALPRIV